MEKPLQALAEDWFDYLTAALSGVFDGFILTKVPNLWVLKNIALLVLSLFFRGMPDGVRFHSAGQIGFILALAFLL